MWTHPGKKLLFMGDEFAQRNEWDSNRSLDWHLLQFPAHQGVQAVVRDLNFLYQQHPALYELDNSPEGFEWVDADNYLNSLFIYRRKGRVNADQLLVVLNFTPTPHAALRIGVAGPGFHAEKFNSDALHYGGSGMGNLGGVNAEQLPAHGREWSISVAVPPLAALIFAPA
jgi:1,4-alpha-glucan branching enzyme